MNTKNTTQNGYTNEKLIEFFDKVIDPVDMAKNIRRINYILSLTAIRIDDNTNCLNEKWLDNGFYWINELAEILDPYLNIE